MKNRMNELLLQLLFGSLWYLILVLPSIIGLIIYPSWLVFVCAIVSAFWFGPWLYERFIIYKLKKNNPFREG